MRQNLEVTLVEILYTFDETFLCNRYNKKKLSNNTVRSKKEREG